jgi:hypothetical protein
MGWSAAAACVLIAAHLSLATAPESSSPCVVGPVRSRTDPVYRARAWSALAAASPWSWPVAATDSRDTASVVNASHFWQVLPTRRRFNFNCNLKASQLLLLARQLDEASGPSGAIALGVCGSLHNSLKYGHVFEYINGFYCGIIRPLLAATTAAKAGKNANAAAAIAAAPTAGASANASVPQRRLRPRLGPAPELPGHGRGRGRGGGGAALAPRPRRHLHVYIPAGAASCSAEFVTISTLFGTPLSRLFLNLTVERAPWVPSCIMHTSQCYAFGGVPAHLRGKVTLIANFPPGGFQLREPSEQARFRDVVYRNLGLGLAPPSTILYVRSARWPTNRRVAREATLVKALAKWAAAEHPGLHFVAEDVHEMAYGEEVARFADARVLISLWGSALHNCR